VKPLTRLPVSADSFGADREPALLVALAAAIPLCVAALLLPRNKLFVALVLTAAVAVGFATATFKTVRIGHTVLARPPGVAVGLCRDARHSRTHQSFRAARGNPALTLERVRLSVRKGTALDVGSFVEPKASTQ